MVVRAVRQVAFVAEDVPCVHRIVVDALLPEAISSLLVNYPRSRGASVVVAVLVPAFS